ncbi:MAG: hypothetical protein N2049_00795 [Anaerolineales bacterium]|nr:hypothetical protein [Anaerolineales bacterium]MCX7607742.1 hypothetical protein [Anaerolineales bacterium]MDW8226315.1 hypothetical protein [Anaerolineales bacterium]
MPHLVYEILDLLAALLRLLGMIVFGWGFGWLTLDLLKKTAVPYVQIALFLGFVGLVVSLTVFISPGALAGFVLGAGAIFLWNSLPKKEEKED